MQQRSSMVLHRGHVGQQFAPVFHRTVRGQQRARTLITPHDGFKACEYRPGRHQRVPRAARESPEENLMALQDGCMTDGLSQIAFASAFRPEKQSIFPTINEGLLVGRRPGCGSSWD